MEEFLHNNPNEEDWTILGSPVYKKSFDGSTGENGEETFEQRDRRAEKQHTRVRILNPIVTLQLIICLIALILSYFANVFIPDKFSGIKVEFDRELYASMLFDGKLRNVDYSVIFDFNE